MNAGDLVFFTETGRDPIRLGDRRPTRTVLQTSPALQAAEGDGGIRRYSVIYATEDTFDYRYGRWVEGKGYEVRWMRARLDLSPGKVSASVDALAGVPVAWAHDIGGWSLFGTPVGAVGRVMSMGTRAKQLVGELIVSGRELATHMAGGLDDLDHGINAGLSIGFQQLGPPKITRADGTREKPDRMVFGAIRIIEASLTPIPQLKQAGIVKRVETPV